MASRSVNRCILVGNLGRDAETKFTPAGIAATRFSVATTRRWNDQQSGDWKEETNWTNVLVWRQDKLAQYLTKGKQVYVEGRLQTRSYDDKDGKKVYATEVVADDVILLGGKQGGDEGEYSQQPQRSAGGRGGYTPPAAQNDDPYGGEIDDSDVPFSQVFSGIKPGREDQITSFPAYEAMQKMRRDPTSLRILRTPANGRWIPEHLQRMYEKEDIKRQGYQFREAQAA